MEDDMAMIRRVLQDIAHDYTLSPRVARALLEKILDVLQRCRPNADGCGEEAGE